MSLPKSLLYSIISGVIPAAVTLAGIIIGVLRSRRIKFDIIPNPKESKFYRGYNPTSKKPTNTLCELRFRLRNTGYAKSNIGAKYKISIKSRKYKEFVRPLTEGGYCYRPNASNITTLGLTTSVAADGEMILDPSKGWEQMKVYFEISFILPDDQKMLRCRLKLWDYDGYKARAKFTLSREGI